MPSTRPRYVASAAVPKWWAAMSLLAVAAFSEFAPAADLHDSPETARVISLNRLGAAALTHGRFAEAEREFRESLDVLRSADPNDDAIAGIVLSNLGLALQHQRRYAEAEESYNRAKAAIAHSHGEASSEYAKLLMDVGLLRYHTGDYVRAAQLDALALKIESALPELTDRDKATVENNAGLALFEMGRLSEAEQLLVKAVEGYGSGPGDPDPGLVQALNALAVVKINMGEIDSATRVERQALQLATARGQIDPGALANVHNNLGSIAVRSGNPRAARLEFETALRQWAAATGENTPEYGATLSNLASLDSNAKDHKRAEKLYRRVLAIDEAELGPGHPKVALDLSNIAVQLYARKLPYEALAYYERARMIQESSGASLDLARTWRGIAAIQSSSKHLDEAAAAYENAIAAFKSSGAENGDDFSACMRAYAVLLRKLQRFNEAEQADLVATRLQVKAAIRVAQPAPDTASELAGTGSVQN